ncbi:MAG: hypothetical protein JWP74_534 [Marmoricola sp.]|nr:hypothetical protein [Marmoricola sp.]
MVADYEAGTSSNQLMQDYNLGKGTVLRTLREAGVTIRNQGLGASQVEDAARRYEAGASLQSLADRYKVSAKHVRSHLLSVGVQMRPRPGWNYDA